MKISTFYLDPDGVFHGRIQGLGLDSVLIISQEIKSKDGKLYYKLFADPLGDAYEVGRMWPKEKGDLHYYSVSLESPFLAAPISAALFPSSDEQNSFNLIWDRPKSASKAEIVNSSEQTPGELEGAMATLGKSDMIGPQVEDSAKQPATRRGFLGMQVGL